MAKEENKTITIDEKEYNLQDFTQEQIAMVNHIADLERIIGSMAFNLQQLEFGKAAFIKALKDTLDE